MAEKYKKKNFFAFISYLEFKLFAWNYYWKYGIPKKKAVIPNGYKYKTAGIKCETLSADHK